jgi:outer membrane protein
MFRSVTSLRTARILLPVLFVFIFFAGKSQKVWTLEDCVNYALDNNLDIKKQILSVESQKASLLANYLNMLPNLNANATNVWNWGQTIDMYTNSFATTTVRSNNFYLSSDVTIFGGLQKFNTIKQNQINLLSTKYDLDVIKDNISLAVAGYYLDILLNMELLNVAREQLKTTQEQANRIQKMVEAGSSAKGDLLNIQAQASSEELIVVDCENRLNISLLSLQQLIDLPVSRDFTVEKPNLKEVKAPAELITPEIIFEKALTVRPEIKSSELRVNSAQKGLAIARGSLSPVLSAGGSWGTGYSGASMEVDPDNPGKTVMEPVGITQSSHDTVLAPYTMSNYRVKSFSDQWNANDNKSLGFYLYIPIFNGWSVRNRISQAKIARSQAELDLEKQKRDLRKTIEQSYADASSSLKKYNTSLQKVSAQEESFNYTDQKFNVGMVTAYDYNNSKKDLIKAQSELLQAKYDFIFKTTILDFYMGNPIRIGIQ